jgi:hypothetical protein
MQKAKIGPTLWVRRLTQACSGCLGSAQAYSPSAQVGSPSAQVKAAVTYVCRLKRNQQKGKLILSLSVSRPKGWSIPLGKPQQNQNTRLIGTEFVVGLDSTRASGGWIVQLS